MQDTPCPWVGCRPRTPLRAKILVLLSIVLLAGKVGAWQIKNNTGATEVVARFSTLPNTFNIAPHQSISCPAFLDTCTGVGNDYVASNETFGVRIEVADAFSCVIRTRGDGVVSLDIKSRLGLGVAQPAFQCTSTARLSENACLPVLEFEGGCIDDAAAETNVESRPFFDVEGPRNIRFLATGDPQYSRVTDENGDRFTGIGSANANRILTQMTVALASDDKLRGAIIAGDLTQVAAGNEFDHYKLRARPFGNFFSYDSYFFEGLGNHDVDCAPGGDCGGAGGFHGGEGGVGNIEKFVFDHPDGDSSFGGRITPLSGGAPPHYSWDWHDVHFVQANVFPGLTWDSNSVPASAAIDPENSLLFLLTDLATHAPITVVEGKATAKPVIITHHYGPDSNDWSAAQKLAYWNILRNHNVVAIVYGHRHKNTGSTTNEWYGSWNLGGWGDSHWRSGCSSNACRRIVTINAAAARGSTSNVFSGVYVEVSALSDNKIRTNRFDGFGATTVGSPLVSPRFETCWFTATASWGDFDRFDLIGEGNTLEVSARFCEDVPGVSYAARVVDWGDDLIADNNSLGSSLIGPSEVAQHDYFDAGAYTVRLEIQRTIGSVTETKFIEHDLELSDLDGDLIIDQLENLGACRTHPIDGARSNWKDRDSDDDGLGDAVEDANRNGKLDMGETDPCNPDSDGDGILDGTESGITMGLSGESNGIEGTGAAFIADLDPATTTDPLNPDTDNDGVSDGDEDLNRNGRVDPGETNPNIVKATVPALGVFTLFLFAGILSVAASAIRRFGTPPI